MKFQYAMYIIVNTSLNMSPGKAAAQAGHAVDMMWEEFLNLWSLFGIADFDPKFQQFQAWKKEGRSKIVLAATEEQWLDLKQLPNAFIVKDAGKTEIEPGSETVIGIWPQLKAQAPEQIKQLRLLK